MSELRAVVARLDPQIATGLKPQLVSEFYDDTFRSPRFYLSLMAIFAALALATSAVGLFALLNYTVAQRTREIGVRLALGADIARVRAIVVRDALVPVGTGIVAGLIGAFWLTRYLSSELFGVTAHDAGSYLAAVAAMLLVAGIAAFLPARRATRINPVETLRE
jgi:ABC-type antimicrobial peptide transport system permease subunit